MSNPLILHGTQIALPKQRLPLNPNPNPLPRIPEGTAATSQQDASSASAESSTIPSTKPQGGAKMASPQAQLTGSQAQVRGPPAEVSSPQLASAYQAPLKSQPAALRSALSASLPLGTAASQAGRPALAAREAVDSKDRDRALNADDRLKRLKLRMQHTIQAYSGNASSAAGAGRYSRTQSLTAASPHTYCRMSSGPVRASRVSLCAVSQRTSADETSSCHSSSSCSSAAAPASVEGGARGAAPGAVQSVPTQRGIPQVASLLQLFCYMTLLCVLTGSGVVDLSKWCSEG